MRTTVIAMLIALTAAGVHAEKRAFTIADIYRIKGVTDPQISPDGMRISFTVTSYDLEKGESNSDIYVIDADGTDLRQLTHREGADYHPRWSPDGRELLFVSTREKGSQVWRLPIGGGEAVQVTDFSPGVEDPRWLPDGKRIVFFSEVFPECGADSECNRKLKDDIEQGPLHAHLADDLLYRHWTFWKDGKRFHTIVYDMLTKTYLDLTPGTLDAPYYVTGGSHAGFDVSPDGTELCVSTNADSNHWETTNKDLFIVPITGGTLKNLTDENEAYDGDPQFSPDGRFLAYLKQEVPTYEADRFRLALIDRKSGERRVLTEAFDYWVTHYRWSPDSKRIYFTADYQGSNPLYGVDIRTGKIEQIADIRTIDSFDLSPDGRTIVASRRAIAQPQEIWTVATKGGSGKRLTTFNAPVENEVDIRPAEEVWVDSPTGRKIHTFVVKPHGFDPNRKYPFILNVHGGPQSQWMDSFRGDWQVYPGAGYVIAFPNPHGSTGYGQDFTLAISRDWAGKVYEDVMAVAEYMAAQPYVDRERMGAMGWSYGGYMMMWMEGHTTRFKALVSMMGAYNLASKWGATEELWFPQFDLGGAPWESDDYVKWSPHMSAANFRTPCLVITGEKDFRIPYTQSLEFFTALKKRNVPSRLIVFENDGHWPNAVKSMPLYYAAHMDWFHRYLGGDPAPWDIDEMIRNRAFKTDLRGETDEQN